MAEKHRRRSLAATLAHHAIAVAALFGIAVGGVLLLVHPASARVAFAAVAFVCGIPLIIGTIRNMGAGRFYVDTIAAIAIIAAIAESEYLAAALVVLMQSGGEAIEDYGFRRANRSLDNLLKCAPSVAHRLEVDEVVDIPASELAVGDVALVRSGDIIAADGIVLDGRGSVDESVLTGEPVPLTKVPGDRVYSGTINLSGVCRIRVTSPAVHSQYELIVRMVQAAEGEKAPINRLANRYAPSFTLLTLVVAAAALLITRDPTRALSVLVVATPCPLIIATPLAVLSAVNRAAALNIIVKSGAAIEQAGIVDTVLFDKTGTLTSGSPSLAEVQLLGDGLRTFEDEDQLLQAAASVELLSTHVLAAAIVRSARDRALAISPAEDVDEAAGSGIQGCVMGRLVHVGSAQYLTAMGVDPGHEIPAHGGAGLSVAFVAVNRNLVGALHFEDRIRPEASSTLERLRQMGIARITMLTGDAEPAASAVAMKVGIQTVQSRLDPEAKLLVAKRLAAQHAVMMVGDGINDAPALATATVGVAMGQHGAGIATDAADIVITVENVERVADVIGLGRRMNTVAKQGILFGIGGSLFLMVLATLGLIPPAAGALLQEVLDLAAVLNAFRAR